MGIERLSVDIGDSVFSEHQVYVALSRATNSEYLHIKNYNYSLIRVNKDVIDYYTNLNKKKKIWFEIDSIKPYYINSLNGTTRWKCPKGTIIKKKKKIINDNNICIENLCIYCNENKYDKEYQTFYNEKICINCINGNEMYKILNKTELYNYFKGRLTKNQLNKIFQSDNLLYKTQRINLGGNKYGKSIRLYLVKHLEELISLI